LAAGFGGAIEPRQFSFPQTPKEGSAAEPETREREPEEEHIETDRDSFTPATKTAGRRRFIFETAYSFIDNRRSLETHSFPELLLRYGLTKRIELRLGWNYEVGGESSSVSGQGFEDENSHLFPGESGLVREQRMLYGIKTMVSEQRGLVPQSAFIAQGFTPTGGEVNDTHFLGVYVFGWKLAGRSKLDAAIHYATGSEREDRFGVWSPSTVLRVPLGERWNVHAEYFGLYSQARAEDFVRHFFSPGVHFLVTPDLEVGVRLGWGLNDQSARFFTNVGLGWRF
jgi:hypothetical protein